MRSLPLWKLVRRCPSIEEGAVPLDDLGEFHNPMMVLVPYSLPAPASVD